LGTEGVYYFAEGEGNCLPSASAHESSSISGTPWIVRAHPGAIL